MSTPYAANAVSSWEVVSALETRLAASLSDEDLADPKPANGYIRIISSPENDEAASYKAEEGIHVVVGEAQPFAKDGAGRAGKRVRRVFQVWIVTRSNQDRAGEARVALEKHLNLEDLVFDALDDTPPDGGPVNWQTPIGILFRWIPGGEEMKRKKKIAPDVFVSVHLFETHYIQKLRVTRTETE